MEPTTRSEAPAGSLRAGLADLKAGLRQWPLWWSLPVEKVKASYSRTYLGMLWMTLTTVVFVAGLSLLFGVLLGQDLKAFIPYVAIGFIGFTWMISMVTGGAACVTSSAAYLKTTPGPRSVYAIQVVTLPTLQFLHDALVIALVIIIFDVPVGLSLILVPIALVLIVVNGVASAMWLGPLCARFPDVGQLVSLVTRILFFFTPIFWTTTEVDRQQLLLLAGWNPLTYFLEAFRAPLLGQWPLPAIFAGVLLITAVNGIVGFLAFARTRTRWAYWA